MKFDDILENHVGSLGRYQALLICLLSVAGYYSNVFTMEIVFSSGKMDYWCDMQQPMTSLTGNMSHEEQLQHTKGWSQEERCKPFGRNRSDSGQIGALPNGSTSSCNDFVYDTSTFKSTIVSEWNLVCDKSYLVSLIKSCIVGGEMVGLIVGGIAADRFGRKRTLVVSFALAIVCRVGLIFSPSPAIFTVFSTLSSSCNILLYVPAFTLGLELIGQKWRSIVGALIAEVYALSYVFLGGLAYMCRERKVLHAAVSAPLLIFIPVLWLLPESPRWYMANGDIDKAKQTLSLIARRNGNALPSDIEMDSLNKEEMEKEPKHSVLWVLQQVCSSRTLQIRMATVALAWFTANMAYYGLIFNIQSFAGDLYANFIISGALEVVSAIFAQLIISTRLGRRLPCCALYLLSGASLLLVLTVPKDRTMITTALAVFGRSCCSAYFTIIYIWTAELFPTTIRNVSVSSANLIGKFGGIIAPLILEEPSIPGWLPMTLLGTVSIVTGLLLLLVPETRNKPLMLKMEDLFSEVKKGEVNVLYPLSTESGSPQKL